MLITITLVMVALLVGLDQLIKYLVITILIPKYNTTKKAGHWPAFLL